MTLPRRVRKPCVAPDTKCTARVEKLARDQARVLKVGVAAARALGFDVLPKASAFQCLVLMSSSSCLATLRKTAPAPGLRPSINAPLPTGNAKQARVCVSYLCWARCDRGAACPEAR